MTDFFTLPRLELGDAGSPFDEAVILIEGREEETIRIECEGALELADRLIRYVNGHEQVVRALVAAANALRACESGESSPVLARDLATHFDALLKEMGAAA
jgi:hypothetical protein